MLNLSFLRRSLYTFEGKKHYENVIVILHRHWFVMASKMFMFLIMAVVPLVFYVLLLPYFEKFAAVGIFLFIVSVYYLFWWHRLFYALTMYLLDSWIVTDHRIIDSEQHGYFNRTVAEMNMTRIQDIEVRVHGFFNTMFDYGDIEVQTAATEERFVFKQVPSPKHIKDVIMLAHNEFLNTHKDGVEIHEPHAPGHQLFAGDIEHPVEQ